MVQRRTRPLVLGGETYRLKTEAGYLYVTVNKGDDGAPTEVFIHLGKAGSTVNTLTEALGRVISVALQYGVPVHAIIKQLSHIKSGEAFEQDGKDVTTSIPDAVAYALERSLGLGRSMVQELIAYAKEHEGKRELTGEMCGRCGSVVVKIGNCKTCMGCGDSTCS